MYMLTVHAIQQFNRTNMGCRNHFQKRKWTQNESFHTWYQAVSPPLIPQFPRLEFLFDAVARPAVPIGFTSFAFFTMSIFFCVSSERNELTFSS
jgi:hypothetical protein